MKILFYDTTAHEGNSPIFFNEASSLGYSASLFDEFRYLRNYSRSLLEKIVYRLRRRRPLHWRALNQDFLRLARDTSPNLVLVVKGAYLSAQTLATAKEMTGALVVNYNTDDPFNPATMTRDLVDAIPYYDLYVSTKTANLDDLRRFGAKRVAFVPFGFNPAHHFPEHPMTEAEGRRFQSDLCFAGTYDPDREYYLRALSDHFGGRFAIYGDKAWENVKWAASNFRGPAFGRDYRLALTGTRVALGLLRKANRDQSTCRTFEIPACGALLLAEDTVEHRSLFRADHEAVYFKDSDDLLKRATQLLREPEHAAVIRQNGIKAVRSGRHTYGDRLNQIVALAFETHQVHDAMCPHYPK